MSTLLALGLLAGQSLGCVQTQERDVGVTRQSLVSYVQTDHTIELGSPVNIDFPSSPTAGNLLIAVLASYDGSTATTPAGWSVAASSLTQSPYQVIFYKAASGAGDTDLSFSVGSGHWGCQIFEFSGVDAKNTPTAVVKRASTTNGGTFAFSSVTTTAPSALVFAAGAHYASSGDAEFSGFTNSFTALGGFTYGSQGFTAAYVSAASAGTYSTTATSSEAGNMVGHTLVFYKAPNPVTDLAVSASVNRNTLTFVPPALPVSHVLVLAKTTDCSFSAVPTGTEAKGAAVGNAVVIFNDPVTSDLASTNVTVASTTTTVSFNSSTSALTHASLTAGTLYCYKAFARNGVTLDDNSGSGRPTRSGTPTSSGSATAPSFVLATGATTLSATSVLPGTGAFYADNAGKLLSSGNDGVRLFPPYQLPDAVQSRGPVGTLTGDADSTLFLSSLDGDAYAVWASGASKGTVRWSTVAIDGNSTTAGDQALATDLYAAPLVSDTLTRVFIGTRNAAAAQNRLYGLNAQTGACLWVFNGTCAGATTSLNVGQISALPILDPANYRLFFTSTLVGTGSTVWALDAHDAPANRVLWSRDLGAAVASPAFADIARSAVYVGTSAGRIYKLNPSTGTSCWGATTDGCGTATGAEQFFCTQTTLNARATTCSSGSAVQKGMVATAAPYADYLLVVTADGNVRLLDSAGVQQWRVTISGASAPLLLQGIGAGYVYVGSNIGYVYELALTTGVQTGTRNVGGGSVVVGDPSYDGAAERLYVGTSGGNLYAFTVPF